MEWNPRKILNYYGDKITILSSPSYDVRKLVFKKDLDIEKLMYQSAIHLNTEKCRFENVAYEITNSVKSLKRKQRNNEINVDNIIEGDCDIPKLLFDFVCNLIQGPDTRRKNCDEDYIRIKSLYSDIIYTITKGRIKPSKHLTLGLTIKSLTNSRKVLTMLNKYGHTINYNLAEEIETELTYFSLLENQLIPSSISVVNNLSTNLAYDNYDRFVETLSGKDTLHDTVGII